MDASDRKPNADVEAEALAHAIRMWEAETEMARRLASRSNSILALIVAVLGYGIWNLTTLRSVEPAGVRTAMRGLLALSLILLLTALGSLLFPPGARIRDPLAGLRLDVDEDRIQGHMTRAKYLPIARRRVGQGWLAVGRQNLWNQARISEAQTLLLSASFCAGAAVVCYFCLST
jgi:hypothetical protein